MTAAHVQRLGLVQLWISGHAVGFGVAAAISGPVFLTAFVPLGLMFLALSAQNLSRAAKQL